MNNTNRNAILKIFSIIAVICGTYPLIALFASLNNYSVMLCIISLIYLFSVALIATGHCFLFRKVYRNRVSIAKASYYLIGIILGFVSILILKNSGGMGKVFIFILVAAIYILTTNFYYMHYSKLTNIFLFLGICLVNIAVMFILSYIKSTEFQTGCIITFLVYSAIFGVTQNQANIDFLITRRNQGLEYLPKRIHRYNMKLFSILGIFLVIAFFLRKPLASFLTYFCVTFLRGLFSIFTMLLNLFKGYEADLPPIQTGVSPTQPETTVQSNSFIDILFFVVIVFILIFIWLKRYEILQSLRQFFKYLKLKILNLFGGNATEYQTIKDNIAYTDYIEDIAPMTSIKGLNKNKFDTKSWRKRYKEFLKMPCDDKSFRQGYSLLIEAINELGTAILPYDTPLDILDKSQAVDKQVTNAYNNIRYGEDIPNPLEYSKLCILLSNIKL